HGVIPLPAPATVECLVGLSTYDGGLNAELVTPTAAALLGALARPRSGWPSGTPVAVGWGKGTRTLEDRPNALRVVLVSPMPRGMNDLGIVMLETNIDDMDGERLGYASECIVRSGALDVWTTPINMKKGRPGWTL